MGMSDKENSGLWRRGQEYFKREMTWKRTAGMKKCGMVEVRSI